MSDITMCIKHTCEIRETCFRYRAVPGQWQSMARFGGGAACAFFSKIEDGDRLRTFAEADAKAIRLSAAP